MIRSKALFLLVAILPLVCSCAAAPLPEPVPTLANLRIVRAATIPKMVVGTFELAPGLPSSIDRGIQIRAVYFPAPGGSFARYLGDVLKTELVAGGKFDPNSGIQISGVLSKSAVHSGAGDVRAELAALFRVSRDGAPVFETQKSVSSSWEYAFVGAEAIPDATNHYMALYSELVGELLADPAFQAALATPTTDAAKAGL